MTTAISTFTGNFTQQEAIPADAIEAAVAVMQGGRLHRYNVATADEISEQPRWKRNLQTTSSSDTAWPVPQVVMHCN